METIGVIGTGTMGAGIAQIAAHDLADSIAEDQDTRLDMAFEPGDVQILHNHQILHARADYEDWSDGRHCCDRYPEEDRVDGVERRFLRRPSARREPVVPAATRTFMTASDRAGSRALTGSSARSSSVPGKSTRAMATRCC